MADLDFSKLQRLGAGDTAPPLLDYSKLKKLTRDGAAQLDFSGLKPLDAEPETPAATLPAAMAQRGAGAAVYRELVDTEEAAPPAMEPPPMRVAPGMMLTGKKRLPSSHGRPAVPLGERFQKNLGEAFSNTTAGAMSDTDYLGDLQEAERMLKAIDIAKANKSESFDLRKGGPGFRGMEPAVIASLADLSGKSVEELTALRTETLRRAESKRNAYAKKERIRKAEYEQMPAGKTAAEKAMALAGQLTGSLPTPETLIPVARGPSLLSTFGRGAVTVGGVNLATDPLIQFAQMQRGTRPEFDPVQPFLAGASGAFLGGTLNVAPEIAGKIARAVGAQLGKAADKVSNTDVWKAMSGWLRKPGSMPDELKTEPTMAADQGPDFTVDRAGNVTPMRPQAAPGDVAGTAAPMEPQVTQTPRAGAPIPGTDSIAAPVRVPPTAVPPEPGTIQPTEGPPEAPLTSTGLAPESPAPAIKAGDLVQWTTADGEQFAKPRRVTRISPDGQMANIKGKVEPVPIAELSVQRPAAAATEAAGGAVPETLPADSMKPTRFGAGDPGTLGSAVPRTQAALENMLDRGDAKRFAGQPTEDLRRAARQHQSNTVATLERLEHTARQAPGQPETVSFTLTTARGRTANFTLKNDPEVIADFREKLLGPRGEAKFYQQRPSGAPAATAPSVPGPTQAAATQFSQPGAAYVGARPQTYNPAIPSQAEPIRRETILRDFIKGLGAPIYEGRIKSKKILGFYRKRLEEVRIKQPADIETAAHEMAHLLDDRIPEIAAQWRPAGKANETVRNELRGVSYDKSKLYEGFAEFVRLWMTQKNQAAAKAPTFYRWFEEFADRSKYRPVLRKAQQDMHAWFEQSALDRARSKIGGAPEINSGLVNLFDRFRQSVTDDLQGIANAERTLTGKLSPVGAYETARLTRGKAAIVEGALTIGVPHVLPDGSHTFRGKGLQQILDPVASDLDDFLLYAVGRSARELSGQGREHLFTPAEIKGMLALEKPEFRRAFADYQHWNAAILDFAEAKGAIDPMSRAAWRRVEYLPFNRVGQPGAFSPVPGDWRGIQALTGGSQNLRSILGNIIGNATMLIDAALTNEARIKMADLAKSPGGARFMARIPTEERSVKVHASEIERAILDALGIDRKANLTTEQRKLVDQIIAGLGNFTQFLLRGQAPTGRNVVAVLRSGRPEYWEVADPLVYRALSALKRPTKHWIVRTLALPKRIGQASITLTLDFLAANAFRDTLSGFIMSRHGFKPLIDTIRGFKSRITADENYKQFIANGGGFSSYMLDESNFRTHLDRFYKRKGIDPKTVLNAPAKLLLSLERIADAVEMSTRLGEMRKALARGEHPRHAAYSAREVSTDFAMRGDSSVLGFFYDTVMFFKAGMNGLDRFYRGLAEDPNRVSIAAKTGLLALLSIGLYSINRGNPLYEQLEDWDRDSHWHLFVPKPETLEARAAGRDLPKLEERYWHFRLPKIWEIGAISSIAERQTQGLLDGQPLKAQGDSLRVIGNLLGFDWVPQLFAPLYEVAINQDRFTGRPIETQAMKELEPWARTGAQSSNTIRAMSEEMRHLPRGAQVLSPAQIEHLLRGYFNTWAQYGLTLTDAAFFDDRPDFRWDQLPVFRRFYRQEPAQQTKWLSQLYDAVDAATEARRTMRAMDRRFRPDIAAEIENKEENLLYGQLSKADQRLRVFRKEMDQIYQAQRLGDVRDLAEERARVTRNDELLKLARRQWDDLGALKRLLLDDIIRERNAYAETIMKDVEQRREEMRAAGGP